MGNLSYAFEKIEATAKSNRERGELFERFIKQYLKTDPVYTERFSDVWLWNEWPKREGPDTGIDLVAQEKDGGLCAIQCKYYARSHTLQKADIDSFFTASGKKFYTHRLIVSSTDQWSKHAEEAIQNQNPPCSRLRFQDLDKVVHNWEIALSEPDKLRFTQPRKKLRSHQKDACKAVVEGFKKGTRGKLIMACGTGKTFTSLRIAEKQLETGGLALFLVPSLALLSQAMREWAIEKVEKIEKENKTEKNGKYKGAVKYLAVCSDTKVGKDSEDISLADLPLSPTTDVNSLVKQLVFLRKNYKAVVIFSTYQSLEIVSKAQKKLQKEKSLKNADTVFDLVICDEAHRTTGIERLEGKTSLFSLVHRDDFIQARKRLYMTATPRLYTGDAKDKAKKDAITLYSMDDPKIYGEEFYRLDFSKAVGLGLLSDYKVLILTVSEKYIAGPIQHLITKENELTIPDAAKIIGCWNGLRYPGGKELGKAPLRRAVAFTNRIVESKIIAREFSGLIEGALKKKPLPSDEHGLECTVDHVSGEMNALVRNQKLDWLREDFANNNGEPQCRILSNARCLSEGVDVPALDAVMFLQPKGSYVDIVQAVGRVMRKAEGKDYGYIILPIAVPADIPPDQALDDNKKYSAVWSVLKALRAHDSRFDIDINQIDLNKKKGTPRLSSVHIGEGGEYTHSSDGEDNEKTQYALEFGEWQNAIYTKIVEKCGDRQYWEQWAKDVVKIAEALEVRIEGLLEKKERSRTEKSEDFRAQFADFLKSLQSNINPSITGEEAVDMLSQHIITQPVFDALFEDYAFSEHNPVSQAMQKVVRYLEEQGLKNETKDLAGFYKSVQDRAKGIDNLAGRQQVVTELYEKFFVTAFPKVSEKLGIVYTPIELVDFALRSANEVLEKEFGQNLSSKDVHILDPFTGTGSFIVRLLQNETLLKDADLQRKYKEELHANEIMLLAYYIAAVNIENAFHDRLERAKKTKTDYESFDGIVFTDTFQLAENEDKKGKQARIEQLFPVNSKRVLAQQKSPIRVILGNPPWSAGQKSENDANKNLKYEKLDARIEESYVEYSAATLKQTLYDSYIRAVRWASDRIGKEGVIAYVTNGSFLDGNAMDGLRKCLSDEFDRVYCFNLRGNARTSGEQRSKERDNVFGQGTRTTVAITLLVKNPKKAKEQAEIFYHDIGDYLSRAQKLEKIRENSIESLEWQRIIPNKSYDWINQRDERFQKYLPMGTEETKKLALDQLKGKQDAGLFAEVEESQSEEQSNLQVLFGVYSMGVKTNRDTWVYNFSQSKVAKNMKGMIAFYNEQLAGYQKALRKNPKLKVEDFVDNDPTKISWDRAIKNDIGRGREGKYSKAKIRLAIYRPFCKQYLYFDRQFNSVQGQHPRFFPKADSQNLLICISSRGANQFSALIVDTLPDIQFAANGQCFALHVYDEKGTAHENITDEALALFQEQYGNKKITKEDLFFYAYAVLHWPAYRQSYASDLVKMLARIPFVETQNFASFVKAGRELARLHTQYEKQKEYPLKIKAGAAKHLEKMRFAKNPALKSEKNKQGLDKSVIIFNSALRIEGIPLEAYDYVVNARPAIEWVMERYQKSIHKDSGITNNPNDWEGTSGASGGDYALSLLRRVVTVSMETVRIVKKLGKVGM